MTTITRNPFHCHGYILKGEQNKVLVVDPGSAVNLYTPKILAHHPSSVIITYTHGHVDHIAYGQALRLALEATGIAVSSYANKEDSHYFGHMGQEKFSNSLKYFRLAPYYQGAGIPSIDHFLNDGDAIPFEDFKVTLVPGHSPGCNLFISANHKIVFSGDVLFAGGGIGRTDFEDGNEPAMIDSIRKIFTTIPLVYTFFPGHGSSFTLENEQKYHHDLLKD
jgi:hydroxyacylglutathione hydrolase